MFFRKMRHHRHQLYCAFETEAKAIEAKENVFEKEVYAGQIDLKGRIETVMVPTQVCINLENEKSCDMKGPRKKASVEACDEEDDF
jgi:hypothetical protein